MRSHVKQFGWFACVQSFFLELIVFAPFDIYYTRKTKLNFCPCVDWKDELKPLFQTVAKATRLSLFCHGFLVKQ